MEIKKHKTWKKVAIKDFAKARKVFLYRGERRILYFLNAVSFATIEDIARATFLSENVLRREYLRELEAIGFIKATVQDKVKLYSLQKWGMYKLAEMQELEKEYDAGGLEKRDLGKRILKRKAKIDGIFSLARPFIQSEHQLLRAKVGAELYRAWTLVIGKNERQSLTLLNGIMSGRFIRGELRKKREKDEKLPIPDFVLLGWSELIFVEVETGANKKSELRDKLMRYRTLTNLFKSKFKVYVLFVVDTEKDKIEWVKKTLKAQQPGGPYVFSLDVGFKRKLVDIAELREWLKDWHELEQKEERYGFIGEEGDIFNLKSLQENYKASVKEINLERIEKEKEEKRAREREEERKKEEEEEVERKKKQEEEERKEAEERKREEEEKKKAELQEKRKQFLAQYTKFDYDRRSEVREAQELSIRRSELKDPDFKVKVDSNNVYVLLKFEDFVNLTTRTRYKLECSQKVREGEECEVIGFENQNGNNPFIPIPLIREFDKPLQKVIKEGVREAILNAQKINPEDINYGMYSIYYYLSK